MLRKRFVEFMLISAVMSTTIMIGLNPTIPNKAMRDTRGVILNTYSREERVKQMNELTQKYIEEQERLRLEEERRIEEEKIAQLKPHYNPYNLRELSSLTEEQIYVMLEGTALQTLSRAYYYIEQEYQINALFIMALNAEESGWGRSSLAISHNNLGGVKGKDGNYAYFNDWGECLNYITELLNNEYLTEDGSYYNGLSIWDINKRYCEQDDWSSKLNQIANELLSKVR